MKEKKAASGKPEPRREPEQDPGDGNQGEGNREADRRYREKATEFARSPRARDAAKEARRALDEGELERDPIDADPDENDYRDDFEEVERKQPSGAGRERY